MMTSKYYMWLSRFMEMNSDYLYFHKLLSVVLIISVTFLSNLELSGKDGQHFTRFCFHYF